MDTGVVTEWMDGMVSLCPSNSGNSGHRSGNRVDGWMDGWMDGWNSLALPQ